MRKLWYKLMGYWRRGDNDGDDTPQDRDDGTGDLIFNTLSKIVYDKDRSIWAINSFIKCANLLKQHERWPDEFSKDIDAPNRYAWWFWRYLKIGGPYGYRSQDDMTRDPYKAFGACYANLLKGCDSGGRFLLKGVFESVKIPWYLYRHHTWQWWNRMIKDNRKHYVKRMTWLEARAIVDYYEVNEEDDFYKDI